MTAHNVSPSYAKFIVPFSFFCPHHGNDYWVALPNHIPPKDPRRLRVEDLHRVGRTSS